MTVVLREVISINRTAGGQAQRGGVPGSRMELESFSSVMVSITQTVGTSHVAVNLGSAVEDVLLYAEVLTEGALVEVGLEVGGTFYPLSELAKEFGLVKLGLIPVSTGVYLRADQAGVQVDLIAYQIQTEEST